MILRRERFGAGLFLLFLLIACQDETTTPNAVSVYGAELAVVDNVVASLAIVPDSQMVFVGDLFKFTAKPRNAAGELLSTTVRWTVGTPTVAKALDSLKAIATFKALTVGTTSIKAVSGGKSRTAKVVVRSTSGARVIVTPAQATVVVGGKVQFTAKGLTKAGETAAVNITWTTTTGTISGKGVLTAGTTPGTYRVIGRSRFGAADTSAVTVTVAPSQVTRLVLLPGSAEVQAGGTAQFFAYGRTSAGDSVPLAATYTSSGGAITSSGLYTAAGTPGTYRVIAKSSTGLADTSGVTVLAGGVAGVTLMPNVAASRPGAVTHFVATTANASGAQLATSPTYQATCGTVTSSGVFTAPSQNSGACLVIATAEGKADTTPVQLLPDLPHQGVPFGPFTLWTTATTIQSVGAASFTASHQNVEPVSIVKHIDAARVKGIRLVFAMTGGSHERFKTDGVFDLAKWQAAMDAFNTPAIRLAVAEGVADGTIIGNSVMDEPQQSDRDGGYREKSWGPKGTMTKARVDGLCGYVKNIFPTLPVGVFHTPVIFYPDSSYRVCEFLMAQYDHRKGEISGWRDQALAMGDRDGIAMLFSLNILDGGQQDKDGVYDCVGTGGLGTYSPNCAMTPEQIRNWGKLLGAAGCALTAWKYNATFVSKPENQAAFSEIALTLSRLPRRQCVGTRTPNLPPSAAFTIRCTDLTCEFTDGSSDGDGRLTTWSWSFGDGNTSTAVHPTHTYAQAGSYQVTLTITDDRGAPASVAEMVTVNSPPPVNNPPVALFSSSCTGLQCGFTDGSTDSDGTVESWVWDFGDGTGSTERNPAHSYQADGTYEVVLRITDNAGATASVTHSVSVTAPPPANVPPAAAFTSTCTQLDCAFSDESIDGDGTITAWSWEFGDGSQSATRHPNHSYAAAGSYEVALTVTDDDGATGRVTRTVDVVAPPPPNAAPQAAFGSSCTDLSCSFTDTSSDSDGTVEAWSWNFGDGSSSTARHPTHTYEFAGSYEVSLTVTDDQQKTGTDSRTITVTAAPPPNAAPTAAFTPACDHLSCNFTDESTDDGAIEAWSWTFGDGTSSSQRHPQHTYGVAGSYQVELTVTDNRGSQGSVTRTVIATEPEPPNAPPTATFTSSCIGLTCAFTDESTDADGNVTSWLWDFGDGLSSTQRHPTHDYEVAGSYEVKLVVTDDDGTTATSTVVVTTEAPPGMTGSP